MDAGLDLDQHVIAAVCKRFGVRRLSVFGSAVTGDFSPGRSDVDFLVEFDTDLDSRFDAYFGLKDELERILGRRIDLVMPKSLDNPYFAASVERSRQEIYAA